MNTRIYYYVGIATLSFSMAHDVGYRFNCEIKQMTCRTEPDSLHSLEAPPQVAGNDEPDTNLSAGGRLITGTGDLIAEASSVSGGNLSGFASSVSTVTGHLTTGQLQSSGAIVNDVEA